VLKILKRCNYKLILLLSILLITELPITALSDWQPVGTPGFSPGMASNIYIIVNQGTPYIAFGDSCVFTNVNDSKGTIVMKYINGSWQNVGIPGSANSKGLHFNYLFMDQGTLYLAYYDSKKGGASVMKYIDPSWQFVGEPGIGLVRLGNMAFDPKNPSSLFVDKGTPYLAIDSVFSGSKVMKYIDGDWKDLGKTITTKCEYLSLFVDQDIPYITYIDSSNHNKVEVLKFTNGSWEAVGNPGVFAGPGIGPWPSISVYEGIPYIAFEDNACGGKITVMKYEDGLWKVVGRPGFSSAQINPPKLYIDKGIPFVAFDEWAHDDSSGGITVMKYTEGSWQNVGSPGFSSSNDLSFFVDQGTPYVAYSDVCNGFKTTVMKYTPTTLKQYIQGGTVPPGSIRFAVGQSFYCIGDKQVPIDAAPIISYGRTLIPVRYLADALGAQTSWDEGTQKVTITGKNGITFEFFIDNPSYVESFPSLKESYTKQLDSAPVSINGRIYLPARVVAEDYGYSVFWDNESQTMNIFYGNFKNTDN